MTRTSAAGMTKRKFSTMWDWFCPSISNVARWLAKVILRTDRFASNPAPVMVEANTSGARRSCTILGNVDCATRASSSGPDFAAPLRNDSSVMMTYSNPACRQ